MIYRKQGSVARWENGRLIRVVEHGVAIEEGDRFECHPEQSGAGDWLDLDEPTFTFPDTVRLERLIATRGIAHHQYGDRSWSEETTRLHVALTRDRLRVLIDQATFDVAGIETIANALARADMHDREAPPRLRLAPRVTAALLPILVGIAPPNTKLLQTAGGIDGYGEPIVEAEDRWPNAYRPSYRIRPMRAPLDLRLECSVTEIEEERPRAIALLAPVHSTTFRVLVDDGARVYPSTVRLVRIDAVSHERVWYPYGAGSFGAEMML